MTSSSAPSRKIASGRLQFFLAEWQLNPPFGFTHNVPDNLQRWVIEVDGAEGTLYTDEVYQLQVDFHEHYPMEAPQVIFLNRAPLHPHIYNNGHICLVENYVKKMLDSEVSFLGTSSVAGQQDNERYVKNCKSGRSPKETRWWFHDDKV